MSTGVFYYLLMFGREMRTKLPRIENETACQEEKIFREMRERGWSNKLQGKHYADKRRRATKCGLKIGDQM